MGKLEINLDDAVLDWFSRKAKRLGQTDEQYARAMIEREARSEETWHNLEDSNRTMRDRMKSLGRYEPPKRPRRPSER